MSSSNPQARVGEALVNFAVKSEYPDEEAIIAAAVESSALPASLELLSDAKSSLEARPWLVSTTLLSSHTLMLTSICL